VARSDYTDRSSAAKLVHCDAVPMPGCVGFE